jgi:hypothetical protein
MPEVQMGGTDDDRIFIGTDFTRDFHVLDLDADPTGQTAKNVDGHTYVFDVRKEDKSSEVKLSKELAVVGTYDPNPEANTQRLRWTCADDDLTTEIFGRDGGTFRYSVKRTNPGNETVVQFGDIVIERVTQI